MVAFSSNIFGGMAPMVSPRILDARMGQKVANVNLTSGELRPLKLPLKIGNALLSKAGVKLSLYRFGQDHDETGYWLHWANNVNVVRGSIADDTMERTYFTGDGAPKYTFSPLAITGAGTEYPYGAYLLGVIKPDLLTTNVSVSSRSIATITFVGTLATATTAIQHKLVTDGTVDISGAAEAVYNGSKKVTVVSPTVFTYTLASAPLANASGTLIFDYGGLKESRVYGVTYVDSNGAEGAPAILSGILDVAPGQIVSFTGLPTAPSGAYNYVKKRIYRTADGSQQSTLRFVGEVPLATTTFTDDKVGTELGENIPSLYYEIPPSDMKGLISFSNGMLAGVSNNQVCISVAYQPHAYPIANRYSFNVPLVALGSFGQSIVVLTKGVPSVLSGSSPESMSQDEIKFGQPCLSVQSVVEIAGGVMWASDEGLAFVGNSGFDLATKARLTAKEWKLYSPTSIRAYRWENRYVAFYDTGTKQAGFVFDLQTGDFYDLDFYASAGFTDPRNGNLYLAMGNDVYRFDGGEAMTLTWKSKLYTSPRPVNMGYGKVVAESYPLVFKLYANKQLKHTKTVTSKEAFALPVGYKADNFEIEVTSTKAVLGMAIAESMNELRAIIE